MPARSRRSNASRPPSPSASTTCSTRSCARKAPATETAARRSAAQIGPLGLIQPATGVELLHGGLGTGRLQRGLGIADHLEQLLAEGPVGCRIEALAHLETLG